MLTISDVDLDPAAAYPEVTTLRTALAARDWPACRTVLDAATPVARTSLIVIAGDTSGLGDFLTSVLRDDPDDGTAAALLGAHLTAVGWRVRGRYWAQHVSAQRFSLFHDWLREAERVLIDGAARNPADLAVWTARMPTARGLELGQAEARRRYDRLAAIDPHHLPAQRHLLQQLCPKWGGSWQQVHEFAGEAMHSAPPGSHNAVLIAEAHIEQWLDLDDEDPREYLGSPAVREALHQAAQHSVWHPDFQRTHGWVSVLSTFAMAFSAGGDHRASGPLFAALGSLASEHPWDYLGEPVPVIQRYRAMSA
ncbi:hypothetical protein [Actinoplanes sp. NPDC049316]|uniref:hypothetical protein n=1 Tax=Actinoplanes sp. NPDC049316 TaxID=3154727 RepID=UPI003446E542